MIPKLKSLSKYTAIFLAGVITATAGSAYGASLAKSIKASQNPNIKVSVNGKQIDATPIIYDNTTYLPLRKAAEAVGGKIELGNGNKSINIVTDATTDGTSGTSNNNTTSNGSTPSSVQTDTYTIEGKTVYLYNDISWNLTRLERPIILVGRVDNQSIVSFENKQYPRIQNVNYYYDYINDTTYYSEEFLLQFLKTSDLHGLAKYHVTVKTNTITSI